ncbi:MAG: YqgE/AlgH family protein [Betaproteobacteria bacterium]|nr:YqgE/AlgH family protein [Betaproteobacteria bacterium]
MVAVLRLLLLAAALGIATTAAARVPQVANGVFLVAKPGLPDPNFSHSVVLVTHGPDESTVGVIINRPTPLKLSEIVPRGVPTENYRGRVYFGGPVMLQAIVAVFHARSAPTAPAFHVLKDLYFTTHRDNLRGLLASKSGRYRIYLGFSSWAPGQLEDEIANDSWYVLPADEATVFRADMSGLWQALVERANAEQVRLTP